MLPPTLSPRLTVLAARITQAADAAIRGDLESLRNAYFHGLLWMTGVVVIGLAMEAPEVWYDTVSFFKRTGKAIEHDWVKPLAALGWLLIIIGVAGEGVSEGLVSNADGLLQTFNNILLAETTKAAGAAGLSARAAANAASQAKKEADQVTGIAKAARSTADDARAGATAAQRQVSSLRAQADSLQRDIDTEKEEIRRIRSPRALTNVPELIEALKAFKDTQYAFVRMAAGDDDAGNLVQQIDAVLQQAKWVRTPAPMDCGDPIGCPTMAPLSDDPKYLIVAMPFWGVMIGYDVPFAVKPGEHVPRAKMPRHAQAGAALSWLLSHHLYPPDNKGLGKWEDMRQGNSPVVRIRVGSKPMQ